MTLIRILEMADGSYEENEKRRRERAPHRRTPRVQVETPPPPEPKVETPPPEPKVETPPPEPKVETPPST